MTSEDLKKILSQFHLNDQQASIKPLGSGLVHQTFLVTISESFVLQKINTAIFKSPEFIASNIKSCADYLSETHPNYIFIRYISTKNGNPYAKINGDFWRLSPFVTNSYTIDLAENTEMARAAAAAVGSFSKNLNGLDPACLSETIPRFHDLNFRFQQFEDALKNGLSDRISFAQEWINKCLAQKELNQTFLALKNNPDFPIRIQHHDTKINNILFDKDTHQSIALCDLDTIMPGYCISDLGDMIRTYTSLENEESTSWEKVKVRPDFYKALLSGYISEMREVLTSTEKKHLFYAGEFLIFMQALRFLADFLVGDTYYPIKHDLHNFNRAKNQLILLESLQSQRELLEGEIEKLL